VKQNTRKKANTINQTSTSNRYAALLEKASEAQQQNTGPENMAKPPPNDVTDVKNISPLIQLLKHVAKQQYEVKSLAHNQVKVQPKIKYSNQSGLTEYNSGVRLPLPT
jgi:hypothetical protein